MNEPLPLSSRQNAAAQSREKTASLTNGHLNDVLDLCGRPKGLLRAPWVPVSSRSTSFVDELAAQPVDDFDRITEQATAWRGNVPDAARQSATLLRLSEYSLVTTTGNQHVEALAVR